MTGKGSNRRPTDEAAFAEGFDRIFRGKDQQGRGVMASASGSKPLGSGSKPDAPATVYVDDASGMIVDEDYWPNG